MNIEKIKVGDFRTNCYIVSVGDDAIVIDPGDQVNKILKKIGKLNVIGIYCTHFHFDHTGAIKPLEVKYKLKVNDFTKKPFGMEVIKTPGHKSDCKTFYFPKYKVMFTGDFLFKGTYGRTDLVTGSMAEMKKSFEKIKKYPDDITIYPGHGLNSNLGEEKINIDNY